MEPQTDQSVEAMTLGEALEMAVCTDPGEVRPHNEDAVFGDAALGLRGRAEVDRRREVEQEPGGAVDEQLEELRGLHACRRELPDDARAGSG